MFKVRYLTNAEQDAARILAHAMKYCRIECSFCIATGESSQAQDYQDARLLLYAVWQGEFCEEY